jgi:hypothetical protein
MAEGMQTRNWHAWRDQSTDGQPCVRVHGECVVPGAGYGIELQRHGSERADAGSSSGELVLDLIVREPSADRGQPETVVPAHYVMEETTGPVSGVTITFRGRQIAALGIEDSAPEGVQPAQEAMGRNS